MIGGLRQRWDQPSKQSGRDRAADALSDDEAQRIGRTNAGEGIGQRSGNCDGRFAKEVDAVNQYAPESRSPMMPDPTTAARSSVVPTSSATSFRTAVALTFRSTTGRSRPMLRASWHE